MMVDVSVFSVAILTFFWVFPTPLTVTSYVVCITGTIWFFLVVYTSLLWWFS